MNKQLLEDVKTLLIRFVDSIDLDLLNPDQFEEEDLQCVKDDRKYAIRTLKKLQKLS